MMSAYQVSYTRYVETGILKPGDVIAYAGTNRAYVPHEHSVVQYTAFVREEISRTVSDSADVDSEIH
jgi:hypothetical protein